MLKMYCIFEKKITTFPNQTYIVKPQPYRVSGRQTMRAGFYKTEQSPFVAAIKQIRMCIYLHITSIKNSKLPAKEKNILHLLYKKNPITTRNPRSPHLSLRPSQFTLISNTLISNSSLISLTSISHLHRNGIALLFFFLKRKLID